MSFPSRSVALPLLAALLGVVFVAGCGKTVIDDAKTEDSIEQNIEGSADRKVTAVDCPSGVEVETGATFECTVTLAGGNEETAKLKILNEDADIELADLSSRR